MYFTPASTDANASTHILSKLFVTQVAEFGKGIVATGTYPHSSYGVPGVISYEYPVTRNFTGDGSGYTWAVSKRAGGVTTDIFTIYDGSGDVNIKGNSVHIQGAAGGWGSQFAFKGSSGTNRGGFGAVGTSDTLDYYWIGPSFSAPHVKIDSSGTITNGPITVTGNARLEQLAAKSMSLRTYETSLATWQEPWRGQASASGATIGFLGATPIVRQTLPAAATDAATTQTLANAIRSLLLDFGLAN